MPSARAVPPRNPTDTASAEATRPIRRRPDIAWRNSLSSKVFVVGRYDFSGRTPLERSRWKALSRIPGYGTRRPIGRGHHRGVSRDGGRGRHRIPSSERTDRRVPLAHHDEPPRDRNPVPRELVPVFHHWRRPRPVDADGVFFQAEDGIRDVTVTGVQTCALPI